MTGGKIIKRILLGLLLLAGAGAGFVWWKLRPRIEPIPAELAELPEASRLAAIRVPGDDGLSDLVIGELRGSVAYFVLESRESMKAREGRELARALDRWVYPDGVRGFSIGEVEGLGVFRFKIDEIASFMRREARLPLYMDYEGAILRGFRMPKGHTAVIVLGRDGEVLYRHSGQMDAEEIEELRLLLGASEPPAPPPAPVFAAGPLSSERCRGRACALVFLARPVAVKEVPGVKGGAKAEGDGAAERWSDPSLRLVGMLAEEPLAGERAAGVFVGELDGVTLAEGWQAAPDDAAARAAFGVQAGEAALVVVDADGRLAMRETGLVPFWKAQRLDELLGLDDEQGKAQ